MEVWGKQPASKTVYATNRPLQKTKPQELFDKVVGRRYFFRRVLFTRAQSQTEGYNGFLSGVLSFCLEGNPYIAELLTARISGSHLSSVNCHYEHVISKHVCDITV